MTVRNDHQIRGILSSSCLTLFEYCCYLLLMDPSSNEIKRSEIAQHVESTNAGLIMAPSKAVDNLDSIENTAPGTFVWLCAAATAIGGMLFGYDTGVISGVLVVLGSDLDNRLLSSAEKELITALCAAGAFCGAIIAGVTADRYGRKPAIWFASILFTVGAIVQASAFTIIQMSFGRVLIGLGVGSASTVGAPLKRLVNIGTDQG